MVSLKNKAKRTISSLSAQDIVSQVLQLAANKRVWVAYSGGVDSHVLLHLLASTKGTKWSKSRLGAIHIDHGLQKNSEQWTQHCADTAKALDVEFFSIKVDVKNIDELGLEAAAREARYHALQQALTENDILLTAQHQHDQAETVLLQLFRGAGPKGLSAMASHFQLGGLQVLRPLIAVSQDDIHTYARKQQLKWVEDPSNTETRWNRNYVRHKLWPLIQQRWPSAEKTISRSAAHCAETSELLAQLAEQDCQSLNIKLRAESYSITALMSLSASRCRNVLRHLIMWNNYQLPSSDVLQSIIDDLCLAKQDSKPLISWSSVEIRRYQDQLYIMPSATEHDNKQIRRVNNIDDLLLENGKKLVWIETKGKGLSQCFISKGINIQFRQGGERIKLAGTAHHKSLKHLFQEWQIPPWQRDRIPLIFSDDRLVAVMGYGISEIAVVNNDETIYSLHYSD